MVCCVKEILHFECVSPIDRARVLGSCAPHSGDWLNVMPVSSCGLFLSDEEVRIVVGLRIGLPLVLPHACDCGGMIDSLGLHCLHASKR